MKRTLIPYALTLAACLMLTGCMNSTGAPETATAQPTMTAAATDSANAGSTAGTENAVLGATRPETAAPGSQGSASTTFDWTTDSAKIEEKINQISEIASSRVVVNGNTALVAVKFASNYSGELTERIREMVAAVIMEADPTVTTVAVTAEDADVTTVGSIADRIKGGTAIDDLKDEIEKILRNATTMH